MPKKSTKFSESSKKVNEIGWKPPKTSTKLSESPKKVKEINSWFESLIHDLIQINIQDFFNHELMNQNPGKFFESWVDLNQIILEAFWVVSRFELISRNPFWVVSWFESIPAKLLWVMSWVDSKLSEIKLIRFKNVLSRTHVCLALFTKTRTHPDHYFYLPGMWKSWYWVICGENVAVLTQSIIIHGRGAKHDLEEDMITP